MSEQESTVTTTFLNKVYPANTFIANSKHILQIKATYEGLVSEDIL